MHRPRAASAGAGAMALVLASALAAMAQAPVRVRTGDHPGFSRIVLDWPGTPAYRATADGNRLVLAFPGAEALDLGPLRGGARRNLAGAAATSEGLALEARAGASFRHYVLDRRLVVDILDPPAGEVAVAPRAASPVRSAGRPAAAPVAADPAVREEPRPARAAAPDQPPPLHTAVAASSVLHLAALVPRGLAHAAEPAPPRPAAAAEQPAQPRDSGSTSVLAPSRDSGSASVLPQARDSGPAPVPSQPVAVGAPPAAAHAAPSLAPAPAGAAPVRVVGPAAGPRRVLLPFGEEAGLAILRRGDAFLVVLDQGRPLDLTALRREPGILSAESQTISGGAGTLLALRLPQPAAGLEARRQDGAWSLGITRAEAPGQAGALLAEAAGPGAQLRLTAGAPPGRVLSLPDPETGLPLLVGTLRAPGGGLPVARRLAEADLLPTLLGVAVLARADRARLRAHEDGFLLSAGGAEGGALALDATAAAQPGPVPSLTRSFDLPGLPIPQLSQRLRAEQAAIAAAPPLARGALRRAAAQTLLSLGLPQEALATLAIGLAEDPRAGQDALTAGLSGMAALLAGRAEDAAGLDHPGLPDTDETRLWRALRAAALPGSPAREAGMAIGPTLPLILAYPEPMRARLLPLVTDALSSARAWPALRHLLDLAGPRGDLALGRAMLLEADGDAAAALAAYEGVIGGRDRRARARAMRQATELRLAQGRIDAAQAAQALEATLFAWRGDALELGARLRIAELRARAGDGQGALAMLRETEALFPDRAAETGPAIQAAFLIALETAPPVSAVALFDAHPEMMPGDARGPRAMLMLAERLATLDLPDRAATLLQRGFDAAAPGAARQELGLALARSRLAAGDAVAALALLRADEDEALPAPLGRERSRLIARAEARLGRLPAALDALRTLGEEGLDAEAELLAEAQDWAGAARALGARLERLVPPAPAPLEDGTPRLLLQQAALLALAGDRVGLAALGATVAGRLAGTPFAEPFAALTADPLRGLQDLPRLQRELQLFRSLPQRLEPLRAASLGAR